jgi:hypothetical protein
MKWKEIIRWTVILGSGAVGLCVLVGFVRELIHCIGDHSLGVALFLIPFTLLFAGVPLSISYFAFTRQYRPIVGIVATIGALIVWGLLMSLPRRLGMYEWPLRTKEMPWLFLIELPLALLSLFGPFYAAGWFYRFCLRFADRHLSSTMNAERVSQRGAELSAKD